MSIYVPIPNTNIELHEGDVIRIGRFSMIEWVVQYGWYKWGGNRPVYGWSLRNKATDDVKPMQDIDLIDVYFVSYANGTSSESDTINGGDTDG